MTKYKIKLYSKNKQSLKNFLKLLKRMKKNLQNLYRVLSISQIKKKRKRMAILKSPHVNKKAQEQFQSITYYSVMECSSWEIQKNTVLLKKIKNRLFPDVKLKIETAFSSNPTKLFQKNLFNPKETCYKEHSKLISFKNLQKKKLLAPNEQQKNQKFFKKTILYLKLLDSYGCLK